MKELNLNAKTIPELQYIHEECGRIINEKQAQIRETSIELLKKTALEAGIKILIREPRKPKEVLPKRYQHPGNPDVTWESTSGTTMPKWLKELKKQGRSLSEFEVTSQQTT